MLLLPGHQHDLWHQYHADKLLTSQDLLCPSLLLILMHSVPLVCKNIFMVNTPPSWKEHYSGFLPISACQEEQLALYSAYTITWLLHFKKPLAAPGIYFSSLCPLLEVWFFQEVQPSILTSKHFLQHLSLKWHNTPAPPPPLSLIIFTRFIQTFLPTPAWK